MTMDVKDRNEAALDFSPRGLLDIVSSSGRPRVSGVTVDSAKTRVIDDGLSVRQQGKNWVIEVSIADVPAMIPDGSVLEKTAKNIGYERENSDGTVGRIFPYEFLVDYVSLKAGQERPAITFKIVLDENLDLKTYDISRTMFKNERQHAIEFLQDKPSRLTPWIELGKRLYEKRVGEFSDICNESLGENKDADRLSIAGRGLPSPPEGDASLLVQESMRLANHVATDFMTRNNVEAPYMPLRGIVDVVRITSSRAFDNAVNRKAYELIQKMEARAGSSVRITSPMRKYGHFLGLKMLANQLDGAESSPDLRKEALGIVDKFNSSSSRKRDHLLSKNWTPDWRIETTGQGKGAVREIERQRGSQTRTLKAFCSDHRLSSPLIAERQLKIDVFDATLVGISTGGGKGKKEQQVWAVHRDPEVALERASCRMLQTLKPD